MQFVLSEHARQELQRRQIPESAVSDIVQNPEQIIPERHGRVVYQSKARFDGKLYLVRVIAEPGSVLRIVTVYRTTRIEKYWRRP